MPKTSSNRFVQIAMNADVLVALDRNGQVWEYIPIRSNGLSADKPMGQWRRLPMNLEPKKKKETD